MHFVTGTDEGTELTDAQIREQCRMYVAVVRIADEFGCDAVGIQYQQGLKDLCPASDLVEGLLNNPDRPPVRSADSERKLFAGLALPHFNEVDECAGVDAIITNRCWLQAGLDPSTTLHDIRWGETFPVDGKEEFVCGCGRSQALPLPATSTVAMPAPPASDSRRCTSRWGVERYAALADPAPSCGAASSWKAAGCTVTSGLHALFACRRPRPSAVVPKLRANGPSSA